MIDAEALTLTDPAGTRTTSEAVVRCTYAAALEPMNGTIEGRSKDRQNKLLDQIPPGGQKVYRYTLEVIVERARIDELPRLNETARVKK